MSFVDCVMYILTKSNRSLQTGLNEFLQHRKVCSKQAFSKRRRYIHASAFWKLAEFVCSLFYKCAEFTTWKGYRLLGVDGSKLNLPDSAELMSRFGAQPGSNNQIQCLLSAVYDVLNRQVISVRQEHWDANERNLIEEQIREETCFRRGKDVFVLDRGYPSASLIHAFEETGHLFVMRASKEFLKSFKLTSEDCIVDHTFSWNSYKTRLRVLMVTLQNGSVEYLVTNLLSPKITARDFAEVYHARWEIEQWFRCLKSAVEG